MLPLRTVATSALLFLSAANAHFILLAPPSLEGSSLDDSKEANAPCGALVPDLSQKSATDFHVDGDFISLQLGHPQANWLFRGTLEDKASGNWTQLFPIVLQSGLGNFCEPIVTAPKSWVNKTGVIGVVANAPDGTLYQCAVVNFVAGSITAPSSCTNASAVTGSFTSDSTLSGLVGDSAPSTSSPPPKPTGSAASAVSGGFPVVSLLITGAMALVGTALL
ncbi:hypothetical protein B0T16DRAFT_337055 [Cercophora newfieldiana]|uniref:Copper acquisition factor BIM1-like domain-containing protein n=1 Tax=Cercophora newfieldiana TaxID=92897 RepID=A0AA39XTD5_9PEZI|nr:hypothetical protein B0T16DRAFT_337055 [Cercophora newfieldiana]